MTIRIFVLLLGFLAAGSAIAVEPDEVLADPALEARARALSAQLRCLVCQNQSIDDSDAALAKDLRVLVRDRLVAGDSDRQILDYLVNRYGAFVLLRPPLDQSTYILWFAPFLLVAGGALVVFLRLYRRKSTVPQGLSTEEEAALAKILDQRE